MLPLFAHPIPKYSSIPLFVASILVLSCSSPTERKSSDGPVGGAKRNRSKKAGTRLADQGDKGSTAQECGKKAPEECSKGRELSDTSVKNALRAHLARGKTSSASMPSTRRPALRKRFSQKPQTFHIPPDEKVTLKCDNGTRLHIPSGSFVKKNGEKIYGRVEIRVREYYDNASMIKAGLGTRSGKKLLRTKGMVHVEASAESVPCKIEGEGTIGVSFPDPSWRKGMKLFSGKRERSGRMDWELEDSARRVRKQGYAPVTNDHPPGLKGGHMNLKIFLLAKGEYPRKAVRKGIEGTVHTKVTITKKGELQNPQVEQSPSPILSKAALSTLQKTPNWVPARLGEKNVDIRLSIPIRFSLGRKARHRKVFLGDGYDAPAALRRKARAFCYRVYDTKSLGWLNCDAFRNEQPLVDQKVRLERKGVALRMLFEERRSLLRSKFRGKTHLFENVPEGKKVHLIAIEKAGDRFRWASAAMKIGEGPPDLDYELMSKEMMEKRMKELNGI